MSKTDTLYQELFGPISSKGPSINSKQKGNKNESALAKKIGKWTNKEFVRVPASGGLRWKNSTNICGDLICTDNNFYFPFVIETKHYKNIHISYKLRKNSIIYNIWEQVLNDSLRAQNCPIAFIRENNMPKDTWYVVLSRENFNISKLPKYIFYSDKYSLFGFNSKDIFKIPFISFLQLKL